MAESKICENFQKLKADLSKHYNGDRYLWLKHCVFEHLSLDDITNQDSIGTDIFNSLEDKGYISPTNVCLLLEITELSELKSAKDIVSRYMDDNTVENTNETQLALYRKQLFKSMRQVDPGAFQNLVSYYKLRRHNLKNIWDVVFHLEVERVLADEPDKIKRFAECLGPLAKDALLVLYTSVNDPIKMKISDVTTNVGVITVRLLLNLTFVKYSAKISNIKWYKHDEVKENMLTSLKSPDLKSRYRCGYMEKNEGYYLEIRNVTFKDNGEYRCEVEVECRQKTYSCHGRLTVEGDLQLEDKESDVSEKLLTRFQSQDQKKRSLGRFNLCLGCGVDIAVSVYNLKRTTPLYSINLYKKTYEKPKTKTNYVGEEKIMPSQLTHFQSLEGRNDDDELQEIKDFYEPGLLLLGFKPRSSLKIHFHLKMSQFLYPDKNEIRRNTQAFSALLHRCLARDKVAICRYVLRKNTPRMVALLPQEEELDESNNQIQPPGFHIIFLPYANDLRKLSFKEVVRANPDQVDKAKQIIKELQFKYHPSSFENPYLKALAINKDDDFTDSTAPNVDRINSRAGALINEFKQIVYPDGYSPGAAPKRKVTGDTGARKRSKTNASEIDVAQMAADGKLTNLKVAALRSFCQAKHLSTTGNKSELVDRVKEFCS